MSKEQKSKILYVSVSAIIIWTITHGYRFMNNLYTCDALIEVFQDDILFQRSLGRFMQPVIMVMRGVICSPWLIGIISLFFMILSAYFIAQILEINNKISLFVLCGILICNSTMTSSVAGFIPWLDVYMIALFLSVLGVWLYQKNKLYGYIAGSICFICSIGFYQAYIDVAITLLIILSVLELATKKEFKKTILKSCKYVGGLMLSGVGYFIVHKVVCKIHHVNETSSYHGLSQLGNYDNFTLLGLIAETYSKFFKYLFRQETFVSTILMNIRISNVWVIFLNICLVISILIIFSGLIYLNNKNKTPIYQILLQIIGVILIPFSINFVCFLSKGMEHDLMLYAFCFIYVFALTIIDKHITENSSKKVLRFIPILPLVFVIWNSFVFSNQVYFKIDMSDRAALSMATRIIDDIEDTDSYVPGSTPVAFAGTLDKSKYMNPVPYLKDVKNGDWPTPFTYEQSLPFYIKNYLDCNINVYNLPVDDAVLSEMSEYPSEGSIKYVGDILVIKISE